jgi:hypothetical protein
MAIRHSNRETVGGRNLPRGDVPLPPSLSTVWQQLNCFLGHSKPARGSTIREWRLSLTSGISRCSNCHAPNTARCTTCFHPRCGYRKCNKFSAPCKTCHNTPIVEPPDPSPERTGEKMKACMTSTSLNLHTLGMHFTTIQKEKHIKLVPRKWWPEKTHTLAPQEPGWWYTISEEVRFQECGICLKRIASDLDEETRAAQSKECKGCKALSEANSSPRKKRGPANSAKKRKQNKPKKGELPRSPRRSLRIRHQKVIYHLPSSDEDDMSNSEMPSKNIGYLCVSADPRRAARASG